MFYIVFELKYYPCQSLTLLINVTISKKLSPLLPFLPFLNVENGNSGLVQGVEAQRPGNGGHSCGRITRNRLHKGKFIKTVIYIEDYRSQVSHCGKVTNRERTQK